MFLANLLPPYLFKWLPSNRSRGPILLLSMNCTSFESEHFSFSLLFVVSIFSLAFAMLSVLPMLSTRSVRLMMADMCTFALVFIPLMALARLKMLSAMEPGCSSVSIRLVPTCSTMSVAVGVCSCSGIESGTAPTLLLIVVYSSAHLAEMVFPFGVLYLVFHS